MSVDVINLFFDISEENELPNDALALRNLGPQQSWITAGRRRSDFWGDSGSPSKTFYGPTTDEDYDQQFIYKLYTWKPVYNINQVIEHHFNYYQTNHGRMHDEFLKHMRYVILPLLKKKSNSEIHVQLFEKWLDSKEFQNTQRSIVSHSQSRESPILNSTVHRIHFDDLSWLDFERLIFAYIKRLRVWKAIDWLGQSGHDEGQDIWGESGGQTYCYQCANYQSLTLKKAKDDIDKLVKANAIPNYLIVVCGGKVAAGTNKNVIQYAQRVGISDFEVWSGADIEENIRLQAPELLKRFFEGNNFPESN